MHSRLKLFAGFPQIEFLSGKSVLITLPSFAPANRSPLIQLLKDNHQQLAATPNWIIDVRKNGGGFDSSYTPLLPWLIGSQRVEVGME
ncbi:S41 family peptidase [Shewanella sp. D64]|uniref:S41 family peptidase n=1 Tax=unclassified Shewanella TaxID=196818 RepID=UPI002DD6806F|nr:MULTISPECIES: S41 family peptidase [unclassified Shewanella]MEC4727530.1 S41 family peptidase [Shewanella sp. D64]MEC4738061.1 S41 family peptidase [Shewanella sp. E94]WBJ96423.1 S41 family peptidase [Shewanella sp. MTB7]